MASSSLYPLRVASDDEQRIPLRAADWLCLAAAPTFAIMAFVTCVQGDGATAMLCSAGGGLPALDGMVPMYVLMSTFHVAPWLRLISRRSGAGALRSRRRA